MSNIYDVICKKQKNNMTYLHDQYNYIFLIAEPNNDKFIEFGNIVKFVKSIIIIDYVNYCFYYIYARFYRDS